MSNEVLGAIERLIQRKDALIAEVAQIDQELERVKLVLTGELKPVARQPARDIRRDGSTVNLIVAALSASEPRTVRDIAAFTGLSMPTVHQNLHAMMNAGHIFRRQGNVGKTHLYARSEAVLRQYEAEVGHKRESVAAPKEADDELGQSVASEVSPSSAEVSVP